MRWDRGQSCSCIDHIVILDHLTHFGAVCCPNTLPNAAIVTTLFIPRGFMSTWLVWGCPECGERCQDISICESQEPSNPRIGCGRCEHRNACRPWACPKCLRACVDPKSCLAGCICHECEDNEAPPEHCMPWCCNVCGRSCLNPSDCASSEVPTLVHNTVPHPRIPILAVFLSSSPYFSLFLHFFPFLTFSTAVAVSAAMRSASPRKPSCRVLCHLEVTPQ